MLHFPRRSPYFSVVLQPLTVVCMCLALVLMISCREKGQHTACDNSLDEVSDDCPSKEEGVETRAYEGPANNEAGLRLS